MKKYIVSVASVCIIGVILLNGITQTTRAEENNSTIKSQATLEVLRGPLKMASVDDIDFQQVEINGMYQTKKGNDISVKFSDYRGAKGEGFELKVKSDNGFSVNGAGFALIPTRSNQRHLMISGGFEVTDEFKKVAIGTKEVISGEALDYEVEIEPVVEVLKTATPGTHQTILTWDLTTTPSS